MMECPEPNSQNRQQKTWRKWILRFLGGLFAAVILLPIFLAGMACFLIHHDSPSQTTVAVPFGGEGAYEHVKELLETNRTQYAGVVDFLPDRLVQRGLANPHKDVMKDMFDKLEISQEQRWTLPSQARSFSDLLVLLGKEVEQSSVGSAVSGNSTGVDSIVIVCNVYQGRWLRSRLDHTLPQEQAKRILVSTVDPYNFNVWNWWSFSEGRRTVVTELITYFAYLLSDQKGKEEWPIRSQEELRKAALDEENAG